MQKNTAEKKLHFHHFKEDVSGIKLPKKFTFPFYYDPHLLCVLATEEVQKYLETQTEWKHNFGLEKASKGTPVGKMFGVLLVKNTQQEIGYLAAFSGKLADHSQPTFFVPPVFNMRTSGSFYIEGENELNAISKEINQLETDEYYLTLQDETAHQTTKISEELQWQRQKMKVAKNKRKERRKKAETTLNPADFIKFNKELAQESFNDQFLYKELSEYRTAQLATNKKALTTYNEKITALKVSRRAKSGILQETLFDKYQFLNQSKKTKGLVDIFPNYAIQKPPAGTGDCAAPKLLQYAFLNDLKPLAMSEFWWGTSPNTEIRKHKNFYPACQSRCKPILKHMLSGIEMDENLLLKNATTLKELEIVFEDEVLLIINKPPEFLSVPGKEITDSIYTRVKGKYPKATGPLIVHRLDMSTSGILILTKTKEANKFIQRQFINRTIRKRYVAVLDGIVSENEGVINLPLRVDLDDRPRQLVCYEHGKKAKTRWKVIDRKNKTTRIHFYPITGRTHQLRVHASHSEGLNTPILGDDLYGKKAGRLHLHADFIEFTHPISKEKMHFKVDPNF